MYKGQVVEAERIIYTPSIFAREALIYLQEVGVLQAKEQHLAGREKLDSFLFFIVEEGEGTLFYEGEEVYLKKGDCVFIDCKKGYTQRSSKNLWKLKWIHFNGKTMDIIYEKYKNRGGLSGFSGGQVHKYSMVLEEILMLANAEIHTRDMMIFEKITGLLNCLMEDSWQEKESEKSGKFDITIVKEYIDNNIKNKILLDELEAKFFINKYYLLRLFKQKYAISIQGYIKKNRISEAKKKLRFSDDSIENIGVSCGFEDQNYFSRIFKQVEGVSPSSFRQMWRGRS